MMALHAQWASPSTETLAGAGGASSRTQKLVDIRAAPRYAGGMSEGDFEIFLVTAPGLESALVAEAREKGFKEPAPILGGVTVTGSWPEVWRANLELRGAVRVLARVAEFRAMHLAQLDKRARKVPWARILRPDAPFRVRSESGRVAEAREKGFKEPAPILGGVTVTGSWPEVWRANLELRGAVRVLARVAEFRAMHLAQLDKRARKVPWARILRPDAPFRV